MVSLQHLFTFEVSRLQLRKTLDHRIHPGLCGEENPSLGFQAGNPAVLLFADAHR
jgi:hypothetical protein